MRAFLIAALLIWSSATFASDIWRGVERIVAVGDVHGAYTSFVALLQATDIIDDNLNWRGGQTHLVSLGDLLDRGPDSKQVMDLLMRLQQQAQAQGGRVHVLVGNHELMNLTGDLRDVSRAEYDAMESAGGHQQAFARNGPYGRWLLGLPFVIRINDTLFTHGGLHSMLLGLSLKQVNEQAKAALHELLDEADRLHNQGIIKQPTDLLALAYQPSEEMVPHLSDTFLRAANSPLFGANGPLWYRGTALCHEIIETPILKSILDAWNVKRVVIGHTPTADREINNRFGQSAYLVDTGMLASVYQGQPRALEIKFTGIRSVGADGENKNITQLPRPDPLDELNAQEYRVARNDRGESIIQFASGHVGQFIKLSKRNVNKSIAAYRLDRMLGLNMVPTTISRQLNGDNGVILDWSSQPFTERTRVAQKRNRPNYCTEVSDYDLLAVFDALIGQQGRSVDNLWYQRGGGHILVTENHKAFSNNVRIPATARAQTLPAAIAQRLAALGEAELEAALSELLTKRELTALLKRRAAILSGPDP
jgi:calcineurin-like phosphoesterase family protein